MAHISGVNWNESSMHHTLKACTMDLLIRRGYNYDILIMNYNWHFTIPVARIILIVRGSYPLQVFSLTCFIHDHD